ncbi:MAG: class I SAM-dependent methyltransferase, partial [Aeromicrobium sp.]
MNGPYADRTAKWLVGDQLACVLHLGDNPLAFQLADQGHEVVVAGEELSNVRHPEISYVKTSGSRLPFVANAFDVIIAPDVQRPASALAEFARVLRNDGLLSTISQSYDDSIPWLRKLRELIGDPEPPALAVDTLGASGLFERPERTDFGSWEQLDLAGLMKFAKSTMGPSAGEETLDRVRQLFLSYGAQTGYLRLRHQTHCLRAKVDKDGLPDEAEPPDTMLLDFR